MTTIRLDLPDSVVLATGQSPEELAHEAKLLLALELFERGRLSSGRAAELSGLSRVDFLFQAGRQGVPVADLDEEELPEGDRARFARRLVLGREPSFDEEMAQAWVEEAERRAEAIDGGEVETLAHDQVMDEARARLR